VFRFNGSTPFSLHLLQRFKPLEDMYGLLAKFEVVVDESELVRLASSRPSWDAFAATLDAGDEAVKRAKVTMKRELTDTLSAFEAELGDVRQLARDDLPYSGDLSIAEAKEKLMAWRAGVAGWRSREASLAPGLEVFEIPAPTTQSSPRLSASWTCLSRCGLLWKVGRPIGRAGKRVHSAGWMSARWRMQPAGTVSG